MQNNTTTGMNFFKNGKNETHKLNPDHHFLPPPHFSKSEFPPQFLHEILKQIWRFAKIASFKHELVR